MAVVNTTLTINGTRYNSNSATILDFGFITRSSNGQNFVNSPIYFRVCDYGNDGIFAFPTAATSTTCTVGNTGLTYTVYSRYTSLFSGISDNIPEWGAFSHPLLYRVRVNDDQSCTILLDNIYSTDTDVSTLTANNIPPCLNNSYGAAINAEYTVSTSIPDVSITSDYSPIIKSVLMIPAAMMILGFFFIIYRIFINKNTRG